MDLIIVTGLSGAGKSIVLQALEDLGYYCIDNLPVVFLANFVRYMLDNPQSTRKHAAIGIDARNLADDLQHFPEAVDKVRGSVRGCGIFFLEADDKTLLKRYSETRRKHPLTHLGISLSEAIAHERILLDPILTHADMRIDTSNTNSHQLREMVWKRVEAKTTTAMSLLFESFAYKKGIPADADFVFDVRCLPNPHWEAELRALNGLDPQVAGFLKNRPVVNAMFEALKGFLEIWIPRFEADNRSYMTVALGCTGGQHRSVYLAELLATHFRRSRNNILIRHRELV